jgi:hypothetical protein
MQLLIKSTEAQVSERGVTVIRKTINMVPAEPGTPFAFRNYYQCPYDGTKWRDDWHCTCNDRCPVCDREIEPHFSEDIPVLS